LTKRLDLVAYNAEINATGFLHQLPGTTTFLRFAEQVIWTVGHYRETEAMMMLPPYLLDVYTRLTRNLGFEDNAQYE
jgi:hypothetical protein